MASSRTQKERADSAAIKAARAAVGPGKGTANDSGTVADGSDGGLSPLEYMLRVLNDPNASASRRDRMAVAAARILGKKAGEPVRERPQGKRAAQQQAADEHSGRFAPAAPPRLSVVKRGGEGG